MDDQNVYWGGGARGGGWGQGSRERCLKWGDVGDGSLTLGGVFHPPPPVRLLVDNV